MLGTKRTSLLRKNIQVLPFPVGNDGAFCMFYWWGQRSGTRDTGRIVPAAGLDRVEVLLAVGGPK
jgi:hypothetical protein